MIFRFVLKTGVTLRRPRMLQPKAAVDLTSEQIGVAKPIALLLDLSGNKEIALEWATETMTGCVIRPINKADLKRGSKLEALRQIRALQPRLLAIFTSGLSMQSTRGALIMFGVLAGARLILLADGKGRSIVRTRIGALFLEAPRWLFELIIGYLVVIPVSWIIVTVLERSVGFRDIVRAGKTRPSPKASRSALYIRATLSGLAEGGMPTHIEGFQSGVIALGHTLKRLELGEPSSSLPEAARGVFANAGMCVIRPSASVGATKALFEMWNNLVFTVKSLRLLDDAAKCGFIYQRYSRFNFTGVMLALVTGLPLALEFNGSEVWVSKHWDPIGQLWLLKCFERANLRNADLVFVVSEVARRELIAEGVANAQRVIVNPNGVDVEVFHPDCGGDSVREKLGVHDRVVVGFIGTFGPWHGAPVLAKAARLVSSQARCHFLFVGDGDERAIAEDIIGQADTCTFTGRVSHERVPAYLDACDILVSPHVPLAGGSEFFGSPTKLFEYMAMARPVIASRLGQIADVIVDGENGILVEPGDPMSLAHAIERLALSREPRAVLGTKARRTVQAEYTWLRNASRVVDAVETVYGQLEKRENR